jgi:uncharacterized protein YllA (UPF0747 family)
VTEEGKKSLVRDGDTWKLRGTDRRLTLSEVSKWIREEPALWSPNVLFRPLLQDLLLPTLASVAGPSEWLTLRVDIVWEFGRKSPIVSSLVSPLSKEKSERSLKNIPDFQSILMGPEALMMKLIEQNLDQTLPKIFLIRQEIRQRLTNWKALKQWIRLLPRHSRRPSKVLYQLNHLRRNLCLRNPSSRGLEKTARKISPCSTRSALQERRLNIFISIAIWHGSFGATL